MLPHEQPGQVSATVATTVLPFCVFVSCTFSPQCLPPST